MAAKNDITGDAIVSKTSEKYRDNYDKIFRKEKDVGLGFNDGFNAPKGFWEHHCEVEDALMGVEKDFPCNWCGKTEEDFELDSSE